MVLTTPIVNGNKSWLIRLILTAVITALLTSSGIFYATASSRITRQEVNKKILIVKDEIGCLRTDIGKEFGKFEERTNRKFDILEERFNLTLDRFTKSINIAIDRIED